MSRIGLNRDKKLPSDSDIEKYATENLNIHKKGIFRKKSSVRDMLSWSKVRSRRVDVSEMMNGLNKSEFPTGSY